MLVRQFISDITTATKQISADSFIPPRFVISEARSIIGDFLKKDHDAKRKLQKTSEGWSGLNCIEMEEVPIIQCPEVDVPLCEKMVRSKYPLPYTYTYSFGNIIKHVSSINYSTFYNPTTPREWNSIQKREFKDKNRYYYFFIDGYIYIPIPKGIDFPIENLRMEAYFIDKWEVAQYELLSSSCNSQVDPCKSPLDYELVIPVYLENDVKNALVQKIMNSYLQIPKDDYPNINELEKGNQKDLQSYK